MSCAPSSSCARRSPRTRASPSGSTSWSHASDANSPPTTKQSTGILRPSASSWPRPSLHEEAAASGLCKTDRSLIAAAFCSNSATLQYMKVTVTITSRGVITLPAKPRQGTWTEGRRPSYRRNHRPEGFWLRLASAIRTAGGE